jgi:transposase InsO family protein
MARTKGPRKIARYTSEFKVKAVKLSGLSGVLIQDVAQALDIHPFMLSRWRKEYREGRLRARASVSPGVRQVKQVKELSAFRARLAALGITQSMKRPREIGDNAFVESFFHLMKAEAIHARVFANDHALRDAVGCYIRRYNLTRLHSSLGYRSPIDYEKTVA